MQLNHILRKCKGIYKLHKSQEKINYLMYTDDIEHFDKNEKELETLTQTVRIYRDGICHRKKHAMLIMKNGKPQTTEGIKLPNQEKSGRSKKRKLICIRNIGSGHPQTNEYERKS